MSTALVILCDTCLKYRVVTSDNFSSRFCLTLHFFFGIFVCVTYFVLCLCISTLDDIALVLQQNRLRWYGHVLRKDDDDWVKKCMEREVEGPRPRGRPKKTWKEVVREDCQARKLNKEDALDRCKWRKMIKEARWSGWVWVGECSFWYRPTRVVPDQRPLNGRCCCCWILGSTKAGLDALCVCHRTLFND